MLNWLIPLIIGLVGAGLLLYSVPAAIRVSKEDVSTEFHENLDHLRRVLLGVVVVAAACLLVLAALGLFVSRA